MRHILAALLAIGAFGLPWFADTYPTQTNSAVSAIGSAITIAGDYAGQAAAAILSRNPKTITGIQLAYEKAAAPEARKVRVLLVPGHEPEYGGAEYRSEHGTIRERDLNVVMADTLRQFLANDDRYQVFMTRDSDGWRSDIEDYFRDRWDDIIAWQSASKREMSRLQAVGTVTPSGPSVYHRSVPDRVALRLYGITKWSNENDMDIVIHIHFNDETEHPVNKPGDHSGFAIYVPDLQYGNGTTTRAIAETIFGRLSRYNPVSSLKGEATGIVNESELIAIGANDTSDAASLLVEYAYIYEPAITDPRVQGVFIKELAYETYLGLQDFFTPAYATVLIGAADTLVLPYRWKEPIDGKGDDPHDVLALQTALIIDGSYPPEGRTMNECPRTGRLGSCTKAALGAFQNKHGISEEEGVVGPETVEVLNRLFSTPRRPI